MKRLFCLLLAASLGGCVIPQREVLRPGASGTVVDACSHRPLSGALVTVQPLPVLKAGGLVTPAAASTRSQPDGSFQVPASIAVRPYIVGADAGLVRGPLRIEKPGYASYQGEVSAFLLASRGSEVRDVGTIALEPRPR